MGAFTSRQRGGVEEPIVVANDAYKYPPKSGSFFGKYFIMGGERFDTPQPEAYLFGENADLNFLGSRPIPFPYPAPQPNEPTKTLKSLVNVRKESLRFVRAPSDSESSTNASNKAATPEGKETQRTQYNIEFTFDSDARCAITILYFCTEEISPNGVIYTPKDPSMNSETYHYKRGANQQFNQVSHVFDPSKYSDTELNYSLEKEVMPIVIRCVAEEGDDPKQSHVTIAVVEKNTDSSYAIKPLKQKQFVDGLCYLLQEIYGIENKNAETYKTVGDEEIEDNGSECVICMSETRDTLILPCRHLCLCNCCADSLRYQANNCPICRAPFRALLQIRALRKSTGPPVSHSSPSDCQVNIPTGYEMVSLIEALNGPATAAHSHPLTVHIPSLPPVTAVAMPPLTQQDAITSPSIPVRGDIATSRPFAGSFSSLQVLAATEDSSAQTDCPMAPPELVSPMVDNSLELSPCVDSPDLDAQDGRVSPDILLRNASPSKSSAGRCSPMSDPVDGTIRDISTLTTQADSTDSTEDGGVLMEAQSLLEVRSPAAMLSRVESKALSMSTPDSLHLCDSRDRSSKDCRPDASPAGEDSDYYTPEDPNLTIFSDHQRSIPEVSSSVVEGAEEDEESDTNRGSHRSNPPSYLEAVSLPGTPLSHGSNRSSGDSFSSMSSTRLLLPNHSHETLAEDCSIP